MKTPTQTEDAKAAKRFEEANKLSPVVSGYALEPNPNKPGRGGVFTLKNGKTHRLSGAAAALVRDIKWDI